MNGVASCLLTNTTVTAILNIRAVLIQETASSPAHCVTALLTSGIVCEFTCCTCMRNTALTSAQCVGNASHSHPVSTSICVCTAVRDRTNVLTASRLLLPLLYCARTYVSTAERSHSSASIVSARSPRTRHMIVMCVARIPRKSRACVNTAERLLRSRTNLSFMSTCIQEPSLIRARNAEERFQALRHVIATVLTSTASQERIVRLKSCARIK